MCAHRRATVTQPPRWNLQAPGCGSQKNYFGKISWPKLHYQISAPNLQENMNWVRVIHIYLFFWHSRHLFRHWQSFWHLFWHSIWHLCWHPFWHSIWYIFARACSWGAAGITFIYRGCENEAFVGHCPQRLTVQDVKTKLLRETSFKNWKVELVKAKLSRTVSLKKQAGRSFGARHPSKTLFSSFEIEARTIMSNAGPIQEWARLIRDRLAPVAQQTLGETCFVPHMQDFMHLLSLESAFRARLPSKKRSVEDVKQSFRGRLPSTITLKLW